MGPDASLNLRFDAETHPNPTDRIAAWRDAMSLPVDVEFRPDEIEVFAGSLAFHPLGTVLLVEARFTPHTMLRDRSTIARSGDGHIILDVFPEGGLSGKVGERSLTVEAGDCLFVDLKETLRVRVRASRFIGVVIPRRLLAAHLHGTPALHGLRLSAATPEARLLGAVLAGFAAEVSHLTQARAAALGSGLVGLIAGSIGTRKPTGHERGRARKSAAAAEPSLAQVQRYIARHASDPGLDPDRLCAVFGLSRAALYRMLKPSGGVAGIIRLRRAAIARHLLSASPALHGSLDAIARASGFSGRGSLRRALLDIYAASPRQLRDAPPEPSDAAGEHGIQIGALFDARGS